MFGRRQRRTERAMPDNKQTVSRRGRTLRVLAAAGLLAVGVGSSIVTAGYSSGVYTGCLTTTGQLVPVKANSDAPTKACPKGSVKVSWNQQGQQGVQGPVGPQGEQGPQVSSTVWRGET